MSENLTIRLHGRHVDWLLLDEISGIVRLRGSGEFAEFAALIEDVNWAGETRVLLGGEDVLLTRAKIPSRQQRQIVQAVPYAVEEELASNVDDCHFALGRRGGNDELEVAVINRAYMQSILAELNAAGLQPTFMSVDLLMIPQREGTNILIDGERAHLLTANNRGFTTTTDQLALTVSLLDESDRDHLQVHLHPDAREDVQLYLTQIQASESANLQEHELDYHPFEFMCRGFNKNSINLLQGEFKIEEPKSASRNGWRAAAILAGCAFLAHVLLTLGQGVYLEKRASVYADEAATLYKEVFPGDRNVRDIRRRWRGHLGIAATDTALFLPLFEETVAEITGSNLVLQNVNYNESRGDLILQLLAPRSEQLVLFVESLIRGGLQAEIGTISQDENSVRGSIKVKSSGGR
ncbi:MAG: type II secretion system protein GspL [Gammaproteobacteria bacterium]|nr:type II secretion system protein GspL [Gammaproteobacteria bacterium]